MMLSGKELEAAADELDKRIAFEEEKLISWGWIKKGLNWIDPVKFEEHPNHNAYDVAIQIKLKENGWKNITEIRRIGKKEWNKPLQEWARYQSPISKKVYTFLEVIDIIESGEEGFYPDKCCAHTKDLNKLIGDNFSGNEIKTWFYLKEGEHVLELET